MGGRWSCFGWDEPERLAPPLPRPSSSVAATPEPLARPRRSRARLPIWWAAAAFLTASAAVLAFDRWYGAHLEAEARVAVARTMGPTASALRSAVERRVALLDGLRSFAEAQPTRARLDAEFPTFAQGIVLSAEGVRALQFVERGVIVDTWPLAGNERALGYNLLADRARRSPATCAAR